MIEMRDYVAKSMMYDEYVKLIDDLLLEGKTTGQNQSDDMRHYATLNRARMNRLDKTIDLADDVRLAAKAMRRKHIWLILTEGWCGDASQSIPVIEKIAAESENIETRYALRDENPELMDQFLTNGGRAIPIVIFLDAETFEVLGAWGSRPAEAQRLFIEMKSSGAEKAQISESLQRWYNSDKTLSIQNEFAVLLSKNEMAAR